MSANVPNLKPGFSKGEFNTLPFLSGKLITGPPSQYDSLTKIVSWCLPHFFGPRNQRTKLLFVPYFLIVVPLTGKIFL